jgi:hypothetical protein
MKHFLLVGFFSAFVFIQDQKLSAQSVFYSDTLYNADGKPISRTTDNLFFTIAKDQNFNDIVFREKQNVETNDEGQCSVYIGRGQVVTGNIDSIIWSDGSFFLKIESDTIKYLKPIVFHQCQLRAPTEITPEGFDGSAESADHKEWGDVKIENKNNTRPKKITVDLTTSYVNVDYPGGKYPIYRHFEWYDADRDGNGNSLMLTYSQNTSHAFFENSKKMGEVKLYSKAFQELKVMSSSENILLQLTKPEPVTNLGITYAIKGPWKILYYIEL